MFSLFFWLFIPFCASFFPSLSFWDSSATTLTKNPRKTNKKAKARNQLEIDEETGLKTTIEKDKTGNSKTTNNSNEPSRTLESKALWVSFFSCWDVICGCIYAAFFHFITSLV
jgi:hypothetical protein